MSTGMIDSAQLARVQQFRRLGLFLLVCMVFAGLAFVSPAWQSQNAVNAVKIGGCVALACGILGRMWCTLYIGGRKAAVLISEGPYSMTRNPLYVFSSLAAFGAGAASGCLTVAAGFGLMTAAAFHVVIRHEEEFLSREFGADYGEYRRRVPRLLPDPRLFRDSMQLATAPRHLYRTLGDGLVFLAALPVFLLIAGLQQANVLPVLLRLY